MPKRSTCIDCSAPIDQRPGRGRARLRCQECRRGRKATAKVTCCDCGKALQGGGIRLPQGEGRCAACRRARRTLTAPPVIPCVTCGRMFEAPRKTAKYCNTECSPWSKRTPALRPRSDTARHKQIRRAFTILIEQGGELCCLCSEAIQPDDKWDLDHTADREGYRGAAHASCNRREGALRRNGVVIDLINLADAG